MGLNLIPIPKFEEMCAYPNFRIKNKCHSVSEGERGCWVSVTLLCAKRIVDEMRWRYFHRNTRHSRHVWNHKATRSLPTWHLRPGLSGRWVNALF